LESAEEKKNFSPTKPIKKILGSALNFGSRGGLWPVQTTPAPQPPQPKSSVASCKAGGLLLGSVLTAATESTTLLNVCLKGLLTVHRNRET